MDKETALKKFKIIEDTYGFKDGWKPHETGIEYNIEIEILCKEIGLSSGSIKNCLIPPRHFGIDGSGTKKCGWTHFDAALKRACLEINIFFNNEKCIPDNLLHLARQVWGSYNCSDAKPLREWLEKNYTKRREQIALLRTANPDLRKTDAAFILSMATSNISRDWDK